jgi:CRP-like cAMP-binding protein
MIQIEKMALALKLQETQKIHKLLSEAQKSYLELFVQNYNISQTVDYMFAQGRIVSFEQMFDLVSILYKNKLIQNPAFKEYFEKLSVYSEDKLKSPKESFLSQIFKKEKPDQYLHKHPFFRAQSPVINSLFCQHAEVIEAKAGTILCQAHQLERDLFFMIEGEAAIYKPASEGEGQSRKLLSFISQGAVIGEVGFFMGELRTADVICTKPSKLVVVRYEENAFGRLINKEVAKNLQTRFRLLHALAKSPFLKSLPESCLDSLMYAGKTRVIKEFEVITQENQPGQSCFVIVSGSVVVSVGPKNVAVLNPGDTFGEIALFFTQGRRTATTRAQRETVVLEIQSGSFYKMLSENLLLAREFEKLAMQRSQKNSAA